MTIHPIEVAQAELFERIALDASVLDAVAGVLGLDRGDVVEELIVRQLVEADRNVRRYEAGGLGVRRAAVGCGFVAGVTFAVAAARAGSVAE